MMFLKNRIYRHKDVGLRFLCVGTTLTRVLLAVEADGKFQQLNAINLQDALEYLELEEDEP